MKKRSYHQNCALAHALDLVGERWSLLLIRELLIGPRRYKDLLEGLSGIGTNLLANRLKEMEQFGLIEKTTLPPPAGSMVYQLTQLGHSLEATILELVRWGLQLKQSGTTTNLSKPEWDIVALRALFNPEAAKGLWETYQFEIDGVVYHATVEDGTIEIELGAAKRPDLTLKTDRNTFGQLGSGLEIESAIHSGKLQLDGNPEVIQHMGTVFSRDLLRSSNN